MSRLIHTHPAIQNIFKNFPGFLREFYQTPERERPFTNILLEITQLNEFDILNHWHFGKCDFMNQLKYGMSESDNLEREKNIILECLEGEI